MNQATTAEWVQTKMEEVFRKYPKPQVDRAYPVWLLLMARDFRVPNLEPQLRGRVITLLHNIGGRDDMPEGEIKFHITRFVTCLEVNEQSLTDIKEIFDERYAALGEAS